MNDSPIKNGLTEEEKISLLKLARGTIEHYLAEGKAPAPADLSVEITPGMAEERAAFVTLHKQGMLRGCIGEIFPRQALYNSVISNALNAAANDPRFPAVRADELEQIDLEISALTVPAEVNSYEDICIGTDGVVLKKGSRSAVFLPQVATEQGWGIGETLTHLSMKAGLPADAWKADTQFLTFQAEVFGEKGMLYQRP